MQSIRALIQFGADFLDRHGVPNARRNAEWLLCHTMGCRNTDLYIFDDNTPTSEQVLRFRALLERRGSREPLQYILETTEFMSLPFHSRPGVFIPRPDTEILVEVVEALMAGRGGPFDVCDLCCGSGVIAVSLARRNDASVSAVDSSAEAVALTSLNAELNEVEDRVRAIRMESGNFLALQADVAGDDDSPRVRFDAVVSNPPYVPTGDIPGLPPEVRDHEPVASLDGGVDGLDFYRRVIPLIGDCLNPGGIVAFEIADDQADEVARLLAASQYADVTARRDYAGHRRVVTGRWNS